MAGMDHFITMYSRRIFQLREAAFKQAADANPGLVYLNESSRYADPGVGKRLPSLVTATVASILLEISRIPGEESGEPIRADTQRRLIQGIEDALGVPHGTLVHIQEGSVADTIAATQALADLCALIQYQS